MTTNVIWHGEAEKLIATGIDRPINCIVTDPPYGADFVSRRATTPDGKRLAQAVANDDDLDTALHLFGTVFLLLADKCAPESEAYVFTRWDIVGAWIDLINTLEPATGFKFKMLLVWDKGVPGMGDIDCNWGCGHELILYLKRGRREVPYRRSSIIAVDKVPNMQHVHPTEKPVKLIEKLLEMSTDPGDLVVDPFSGSGSTSVAAQRLGRDSIGIEKMDTPEQPYVTVALRRLDQLVLI